MAAAAEGGYIHCVCVAYNDYHFVSAAAPCQLLAHSSVSDSGRLASPFVGFPPKHAVLRLTSASESWRENVAWTADCEWASRDHQPSSAGACQLLQQLIIDDCRSSSYVVIRHVSHQLMESRVRYVHQATFQVLIIGLLLPPGVGKCINLWQNLLKLLSMCRRGSQ